MAAKTRHVPRRTLVVFRLGSWSLEPSSVSDRLPVKAIELAAARHKGRWATKSPR